MCYACLKRKTDGAAPVCWKCQGQEETAMMALDKCVAGVYNRFMVRFQIHLTKDRLAKLRERSTQTGLSVAALIRLAIDRFLEGVKVEDIGKGT